MILGLLTDGKDGSCNLCMYEFDVKLLEFQYMLFGIELLCRMPVMFFGGFRLQSL